VQSGNLFVADNNNMPVSGNRTKNITCLRQQIDPMTMS
jgi:hypothetical protein